MSETIRLEDEQQRAAAERARREKARLEQLAALRPASTPEKAAKSHKTSEHDRYLSLLEENMGLRKEMGGMHDQIHRKAQQVSTLQATIDGLRSQRETDGPAREDVLAKLLNLENEVLPAWMQHAAVLENENSELRHSQALYELRSSAAVEEQVQRSRSGACGIRPAACRLDRCSPGPWF